MPRKTSQRNRSRKSSKSSRKRKGRSRKRREWQVPDLSWLFHPLLWAALLVVFALLTVGTLFSPQAGGLLGWWRGEIRGLVGDAIYVVPLLALALAWWLMRFGVAVVREEEAPSPTLRFIGILLFLAGLSGLFHRFAFPADPVALAEQGGGGGKVGLVVSDFLARQLGPWLSILVLLLGCVVGLLLLTAGTPAEAWAILIALRDMVQRRGETASDQGEAELPPWEPVPVEEAPPLPWWRRVVERLPFRKPKPQPETLPTRVIGEGPPTEEPAVSPYAVTEEAPPPESPAPAPPTPTPAASPEASPAPQTAGPQKPARVAARAFTADTSGTPWQLPDIRSIFEEGEEGDISTEEIRQRSRIIEETLASFGVPARVVEVNRGPTVTQYGVQPGYIERVDRKTGTVRRERVKVSRIVALQNDLALALAAAPIRIQAPVPGKPYVGIEVPNKRTSLVTLRSVLESEVWHTFKGRLKIALGRDVAGQPVVADLARMPHLLIAGATGSGKSVCINAIICCLMATHTPDEVRFILIDPKRVELTVYNGSPHLIGDVVTDTDMVVDVLQWAVREMERRYLLFAEHRARDIVRYNQKARQAGEQPLPYIVIVIDELADLMLAAPDEVERSIVRLAQMARATGIHLVVATQRPSVDVVTGLIKANFPARIAFAVTSQVDSRVILDSPGAEQLLGQGDMLFLPPDSSKLARLQGVFVSDREIQRLVAFWKAQARSHRAAEAAPEASGETEASEATAPSPEPEAEQPSLWEDLLEEVREEQEAEGRDPLFDEAVRVVREANRASISLLQRRLKIGYARAGRLIDQLEEAGIIGPDPGGGRSRVVYPPQEASPPATSGREEPPADDTENTAFANERKTRVEEAEEEDTPRDRQRPRLWF